MQGNKFWIFFLVFIKRSLITWKKLPNLLPNVIFWSVNFLKLCVFGMICQQTNVGTYLIWSSVWPVSVLKYHIITHSHTSSYYLLLVKDTIVLGCDQSKWNMYPAILICMRISLLITLISLVKKPLKPKSTFAKGAT